MATVVEDPDTFLTQKKKTNADIVMQKFLQKMEKIIKSNICRKEIRRDIQTNMNIG
jgi:hypothetical protein